MELITDITITIDGAEFKDPKRLIRILPHNSYEKIGSCYKVRGTFEQLDRLSVKLQDEHAFIHLKPVDVSVAVMNYIDHKCAKDLSRIEGHSFVIDRQPVPDGSSTVQVTLRPCTPSTSLVRADLVRQRFITFYQRIASDLETTAIHVSPHRSKELERRFPQALFKRDHDNCGHFEVSGPFWHIRQLKDFTSQNAQSARKNPAATGPADSPGSRTLGALPTHSKEREDEESCPICMETIATAEKKTLRCKHSFCKSCVEQAFLYKPVCPTCGELYGTLTGTQPKGGTMHVSTARSSLPGYEKCATIVIQYYIPNGIQKEEHPNPGRPYEGVSRTAYLPDSSEGRRILKLLQRAFDQRLVFTVGRSTTSGRNNTVTWNDIHHKTSTRGGPTHYGYPDPDYLSRVRDELKVKGIE